MNEHRSSILTKKDKGSIPKHFKEAHGSEVEGLKVFGIEAIQNGLDSGKKYQILCKREAYWIFTLGSMVPNGLNEEIVLHTVT